MMNLGKKLGFAALLAFGTVTSANAGLVVLDTFDYDVSVALTGDQAIGTIVNSGPITDINAALGDVEYSLELIAASGSPASDSTAVTIDLMGDGVLSYSNDTFMGTALSMLYSDTNGNAAGPLDLTAGGSQDSFFYDVLSSNVGFDVSILVGSEFGVSGIFGQSSPTFVESRETVSFDSLNALVGAGADFENALWVKVTIASIIPDVGFVSASDLAITEFGTIPEPTTVAIFGLALVGLGLSRRKAK